MLLQFACTLKPYSGHWCGADEHDAKQPV